MRHVPLLAFVLACGSAGAETTDTETTASAAGTLEMRGGSSGPSSGDELGRLEPTSTGEAVATDRSERESRPGDVDTDPIETREGELPLTPSARDQGRIFRQLRPNVEHCLRGLHVRFDVRLRVLSSGIVRDALVEGEHIEGTDRAQCIESLFRNVMFPAFRDPEATVRHGYRF